MQPSEIAKLIVQDVSALLSQMEFRRRSRLFSRPLHDVVQLIQIQASQRNSQASSSFTINLGVLVPVLEQDAIPSIAGAHWRQRLGFLCPEHKDLWWQASDSASAQVAGHELVVRLQQF